MMNSLSRHLARLLAALFALLLAGQVSAFGERHVLVLNSYHQGMEWTDDEIAGLYQGLGNTHGTQFHIEYMDAKRYTGPEYTETLRQLFARKYRATRFDAIVATDNDAFDFLVRYRDTLFPGVPAVFAGVNGLSDAQARALSNFTGVVETAEHAETVALMLHLHPEAKRIVAIMDSTTTGKAMRLEIEALARSLKGRVSIEIWSAYSPDELAARVATLPADTLIMLLPYGASATGEFISHRDIAELISSRSAVPVYASWDLYLGYGIVGGRLTTAKAQGAAAGEMLRRILAGEKTSAIPVRRQLPTQYYFDYAQLRRFDIPLSNLPINSRIINQPWSESNKATILILSIGALLVIALSGSLIVSMWRKRRADVELRIAAKAFDSQVAMMVADAQGVILRVNKAFTLSTGYSAEEAVGSKASILRSGRHDKVFYAAMWKSLRERHYWQGVVWNRRKDGNIYAEWLTINGVLSPSGRTTHYVGSFSDITQNKDAEAEVHRLAYYDQLTQLPNRRLLQDRLAQALATATRRGSFGAVFFLDLDNFKTLNDTLGHDTGDQLLVKAAQRLRESVREADTVARLGGDEFVLILEGLGEDSASAAAAARDFGERLRSSSALPYSLQHGEHVGSASLGICLFSGSETVEQLLKNADIAMYRAKGSGRNTVCFFDLEMQSALDKRSTLATALRQAQERRELQLFYQPQIDGSGRVVGAEALLRWITADGRFISPGEFIPLAEETGMILPIGAWVMASAGEQIKRWEADPCTSALPLSVNVSAAQFRQDDFVDKVRALLEDNRIDPSRLKLELTESMVLDDIDAAIRKMQTLREAGVKFSMDDFGTGYSSLAYLTRLPLDEIKIDKSFVGKLPGAKTDSVIVDTIITMGHSLGLRVVAEGVETEAQRRFLLTHGCNIFQGYLFSRALPAAEFSAYLEQQSPQRPA